MKNDIIQCLEMCQISLTAVLLFSITGYQSSDGQVDCGPPPPASLVLGQANCAEFFYTSLTSTTYGSTLTFYCESLLIRTAATFDYCPVIRCESDGFWRLAQLSCGGGTECYGVSTDYIGRRTCTASGKLCERWDRVTHNFDDTSFPNNNMSQSASYCRDPAGTRGFPWCYTTLTGSEWEECSIPLCSAITIGQGRCPNDYCGDPSTISTDNSCVNLQLVADNTRNVGTMRVFKCVSLLVNFTSTIDYCPVQICMTDTYYSDANITCGTNECYTVGNSRQYQGRRTCTATGKPCQRWSAISHTYQNTDFPDGTVAGAGSYCRDPLGEKLEPWCFITGPTGTEWEYCGVSNCSSLKVDYGRCPAPVQSLPTPVPPATTTPVVTASWTIPATVITTVTPSLREDNIFVRLTGSSNYGFQSLMTISNVKSAISCASFCSGHLYCGFVTFVSSGACTLYTESAVLSQISCDTFKCYIRSELLLSQPFL